MAGKQYLSKENVESIWELSLLQEEMFQKFESNGNESKNMLWIDLTINGPLHPGKLQEAWKQTVARTPILRTVFRKARNRTVQVVLEEYPIPLEIIEAKDHQNTGNPGGGTLPDQVNQSNPFNLMEEPAVNIKLLHMTHKTVIFLMCHRIIMDKKSMTSVFEDFMSCYTGLLANRTPPSSQRPHFKHYLDWLDQQYWLPAIAYWEKEFADFTTPTRLMQYQWLEEQEMRSYPVPSLDLPKAQSRGLEQWCRQEGFSPGTLVQAAWALVLNLYSRETDIYFGVELQGPPGNIPAFQTIIGPFANILPLRVTIHARQTLRQFLGEIQEKNRHLLQYSYIPLQEIRAKIGLDRETKLFDSSVCVNVNHENLQKTGFLDSGDSLQLENINFWQDCSHSFALEVFTGKQWQLRLLSFKTALPDTTASRVLEILQTLLAAIPKDPDARLSHLDYLSIKAWEKLDEFNRADIHLPGNCLETAMHQVFENQVEKRPSFIACTWGNHHLSYRELNKQANRLAYWLREQGISANDLVGIFCERSTEMLVAILAVFKAGGAYIPFDPANPDSRLKTIILDCRMKVILTRTPEVRRVVPLVKELPVSIRVFCLEPMPGEADISNIVHLEEYSPNNLSLLNRPGDTAYVLFTSGSTGIPKGAVVEHIGMVNHLWTKIRLLQLSHTTKLVQNASHCFDISVWQFLAALMKGGQTVIYSNEVAMDPLLLLESLRKHRVTILEMVPAVIGMVLHIQEHPGNSTQTGLPDIEYMLSTGEALPAALCRKWREKYPHIPVVNAYGPTECSDDTHHRIVSSAAGNSLDNDYHDVPLGKTIPNFNCFILDAYLRQVPPGCPGEICLTGIGVGKGYLNDPECTAENFIRAVNDRSHSPHHPNTPSPRTPYSPHSPYSTIYKTGDLGTLDDNGELIFLGRIDLQVKIRGFRIELGEIETQLRKHPAVKQCVAVICQDVANPAHPAQQNRLAAYVVLNGPASPAELRNYLQEILPAYMLPGHIIRLETLPLNRSGKIDRQALPHPDQVIQSLDPMDLPKTHIEKTLAQIWEDVLDVSPIGMNFNFFQLGGHSLKIIQVRSRIIQLLGVNIPIIELFSKPTFRLQAQLLEERAGQAKTNATQKQQIPKLPEASYYPISHAQQRLFFLHQIEPDSTGYNLYTVIESRQPLHLDYLKKAVQTIGRRQDTLRTTFGIKDNKPVQYVARQYEACFKVMDFSHIQSNRQEQMLSQHLEKEINSRFDLTKGPLFYTIVFKLEEKRHLLFFHMHHIITDFWSWEIFFKELYTLYQGYIQGTGVSLPRLHIQYSDYAAWQNKSIEKGDFQVHADYWKEQLAGELPVMELPLDFPRPLVQEFSGGSVGRTLPKDGIKPLYQLFQQKNVTAFIGLLAVFYTFLYRITGQEDIIIGTPEAGRNQVEVEKLIGFFVNTLPLRINIGGDPTFSRVLDRVKQVSLEAYEHAQYPYDLIIGQLNLERDLGRNPLFSVMFQVNEESGGDANSISNPALMMDTYEIPTTAINFDFHVTFIENNRDLGCNFCYCKKLFKEETIKRWLDHFFVLLDALIAAPETRILCAPILTPQQKEQLLFDWNDTHVEYPEDHILYVHTMFENQVEKTPGAAALAFADRTITYRQLNRQANRLSFLLDEKGVLPGSIVGIHMDRCLNMVVAMLGILKTGAVYMPLDPALPVERLEYMTADANVSLLVAGPFNGDKVKKEFAKTDRLCIRETGPGPYPGENRLIPRHSGSTGSTAYILYTSGSTGTPKGVQVSHLSLTNFIRAMTMDFINENDIMLAVTNFTFDISFLELVLPLTAGSQVVLAGEDEIRNGELLRDKLAAACATVMQGTPATWKLLLQSGWQGTSYLKGLVGGEALPLELARSVVKKCHSLRNMYGPTEATIWASFIEIPVDVCSITIGRPIIDTQMYILDPAHNPVPIGVTGELYIGGKCLAQGYVNAPELTAKIFIPSPFDMDRKLEDNGKNRLYKTGDLVRYRDEGYIEFIGREDHQVKIRGYRIELGEIENHLLKKDNIKEAVILVKKDKHNEKYLCAYIMFDGMAAQEGSNTGIANTAELGEYLAARLPRYMVPAQFIKVRRLPLTSSGKIDRKTLAGIGEIIGTGVQYQPPGNIIEKIMTDIWKDVLEVETVSINDNFFRLGGHSLKAVKLISKLEENGIHISINELFRYQDIKKMARYILDNSNGAEDVYLIENTREARQIFENQFKAKGEFVNYHVGETVYRVFYVEDTLQIEYTLIARFFSRHLSREINPHFIKPVSQKPPEKENDLYLDNSEFTKMMQLKNDTGDFARHSGPRLKEELAQFNETIVTNQTVKQYKLSPMQQGHLTLENRFTGITISFDKHLDIQLLEEALLELIENQGLLRSTLVKKNGDLSWNEFQAPVGITIPYLDLMDYGPECKEKLISEILKQMKTGDFNENSIMYRLVLFKKDLRNHLLVIYFDHSIFDAMSGEIIRRNLMTSYRLKEKNQNIRQPEPKSYSDYIEQISLGPLDINEDQLIDIFQLEEFCQAKQRFEKIIREKETGHIDLLNYELPFMKELTEEKAWELSFFVFNLFLKRYSGLSQIPVKIVSYGRLYRQSNFFDTVGEFIDLVPVLVHVNEENPLNMSRGVRKKLEKVSKHNINFMGLTVDKILKEKWKKAAGFIIPEQLPANDPMILFNFVGKTSEEQTHRFKRYYTGTAKKESKICSFQTEVYYTSRALYFYISTSLEIAPGTFDGIKISGEELKK